MSRSTRDLCRRDVAGDRYSRRPRPSDRTKVTPSHVVHSVWPVLVVLLYVLVSSVLRTLAAHQRYAMTVHDLVLDSKVKRKSYDEAVADTRDGAGK